MTAARLQGQTALVTGASSGIGKAIAVALGKEGVNVVINFHSEEDEAEETLQEIKSAKGEAIKIKADISTEAEVISMFDQIFRQYNTIDILVNNAGIQKDSKFPEMTLHDWQRVIDVNLTGHFLCSRQAVKEFLKKRNCKRTFVRCRQNYFYQFCA